MVKVVKGGCDVISLEVLLAAILEKGRGGYMPEHYILLCSQGFVMLTLVNNCIAKMEVGCLKYPGASTIGSQPLD